MVITFDEDITMVFSLQVNDAFREDGNRTGTFLIYLSDVEAGGATVSPYLRVAIEPRKGSAVFFLDPNRLQLNGSTNQDKNFLIFVDKVSMTKYQYDQF